MRCLDVHVALCGFNPPTLTSSAVSLSLQQDSQDSSRSPGCRNLIQRTVRISSETPPLVLCAAMVHHIESRSPDP
ncbi:hypothetical protein BD311DRAFT_768744, partial [Dichomitus squalens]